MCFGTAVVRAGNAARKTDRDKEANPMNRKGLRFLSAFVAAVLALCVCLPAFAYDTIPFGSEGEQVTALQRALKSKGYYKGTVDGSFGQKTRSAVYRYQRDIGLTTDGKAGDKTLTALYDGLVEVNEIDAKKASNTAVSVKNTSTLYYGCTGSSVKSLQRMLKKTGYFKGSIDGKFGDLTVSAVKKFQWAKGLNGDGLAGTQTLKALKKAVAK